MSNKDLLEQYEPPPIAGTWQRMYVAVLLLHALIIAFFYWLTLKYL